MRSRSRRAGSRNRRRTTRSRSPSTSRSGSGSCSAAFPAADVAPVEPGWEDRWRSFHRPVRAGGLWIGPPWEHPDAGEPAVVIEPGRAFGTGAHPTTRLCIELLARTARGSLLDVGCGSGVLSIAAVRLGFGPVHAVDNDPVAVETTRANAAVNGVAIEALVLDGVSDDLPDRGGRRRERAARPGRGDPGSARRARRDHVGLPRGRSARRAGLGASRPWKRTAGRPTSSSGCRGARLRRAPGRCGSAAG